MALPPARTLLRRAASRSLRLLPGALQYRLRIAAERIVFNRTPVVHDLPPIFHYWSNRYLRPQFEALGFSSPDDFFFRELLRLAADRPVRCLSLGSGRCETELALAARLAEHGAGVDFVCTDLNRSMLDSARRSAEAAGLAARFEFRQADVNRLAPLGRFDAVLANQCLHHFVELEAVFDGVHAVLEDNGLLLVSDVIGRNGHQLWPEALEELQRFWRALPERLRVDRRTGRVLAEYDNLNHADIGFEGVRAQDILPLLLERFRFEVFAPHSCIVTPLIDRRFGWNYDADSADDRRLIDQVAQHEMTLLRSGTTKPTQLVATLTKTAPRRMLRTLPFEPSACVRQPTLDEPAIS